MNEFNLYSSENPYYQDPLSNEAKNIYIPVSTKETNVFFINDQGKLKNMSKDSGLDFLGNSRSAAYLENECCKGPGAHRPGRGASYLRGPRGVVSSRRRWVRTVPRLGGGMYIGEVA